MWHKVARTGRTPNRSPGRTLFVVADEALQSAPVVVTPKSSQVTRDTRTRTRTHFLPKKKELRQILCGRHFVIIVYHYFVINNLFVCCNWSSRMAWIFANLEQAMYQFSRKACLGQCPGWKLGTGCYSIPQVVCPGLQSRCGRCLANQSKMMIMEILMSWIMFNLGFTKAPAEMPSSITKSDCPSMATSDADQRC